MTTDTQDVFVLTADFEPLVFEEPVPYVAPELADLMWDEMTEEQITSLSAEEQATAYDAWLAQFLADPEMVAFYTWVDMMNAYCTAPTLEAQLAIVAPYQQDVI